MAARGEDCGKQSGIRTGIHKVDVGAIASRQAGRITRRQLLRIGLGAATIDRYTAAGYLRQIVAGVFAVGHQAPSVEADLWTAVLYAGPGAELSHGTAAWWRGWLERPVSRIHVSTPRQRTSPPEIVVHGRRDVERELVRGIPVTTIPQTMLDLAATEPLLLVRKALAELDYGSRLDIGALTGVCGSGRAGSAMLMRAIRSHMPELARTRSRLEVAFLLLCERHGLPLPLCNRVVNGVRADCWWPQLNLVVELDGLLAHRSPERMRRDHRNELILRHHGILTVRYDEELVETRPLAVRDDLRATMVARGL